MKVLFVCTGNTCRSPMAEGLFNKLVSKTSDVFSSSAGISVIPGSCVSDLSVKILKEHDIDISKHTPKQINESMIRESDLIITMSRSHKICLINHFPQYESKILSFSDITMCEDIFDPYGGNIDVYRQCYEEIYKSIMILIERINPDE